MTTLEATAVCTFARTTEEATRGLGVFLGVVAAVPTDGDLSASTIGAPSRAAMGALAAVVAVCERASHELWTAARSAVEGELTMGTVSAGTVMARFGADTSGISGGNPARPGRPRLHRRGP